MSKLDKTAASHWDGRQHGVWNQIISTRHPSVEQQQTYYRQKINEIQTQYDACIKKQSEANTDKAKITSEISSLQSQYNQLVQSMSTTQSGLTNASNQLKQSESSNANLSANINKEQGIIDKLSLMLEQYNEYTPKVEQGAASSSAVKSSTEKTSELAGLINDLNISGEV